MAHLLWRGLEQGVGELGFCRLLIVVSWLWIVRVDSGVSAERDLLGLVWAMEFDG